MPRWLMGLLVGLLVGLLLVARGRTAPPPDGPLLDPAALGLLVEREGLAQVPPDLAATMAAWPPATAPSDPAEVELGRLLFFDPLLSQNEQVSCATCHHPDLGFSDGLAQSVGVSGVPLRRSAPALWNVGLRGSLTWDGRAATLQQQMVEGPLIHPDEMGESPAGLVAKLQENADYRRRFEALYGDVSVEHLANAIAAFQQSLLSADSPFDRYARGDFYALTGAQRRGFELFRSPQTNCIKCHELPTFATDQFKVIGVGDGGQPFDPGRGAITGQAAEQGAFAVPTLRNVALSAPYMHNGIEPELNGVISFYLNGGGDNLNVPRGHLDPDLRSFNVPTRALRDLEAFLLALTDESALPPAPDALPSGLPPLPPRENPARARVAAARALPPGPPRTHTVEPGQSIQAAIDRARPGDTVRIAPGRYFEALAVDVEGLTIQGEGAILVGRQFTPIGVTIRNHGVTLVGLAIEGFQRHPIAVHGAQGTTLQGVTLGGRSVTGEIPLP